MPRRRSEGTTKVSITIATEDLDLLRERASRLHHGNLSAAVGEGVACLRRKEAGYRVLAALGGPRLTKEQAAAIDAGWRGEPAVKRRRRKAA